MNLPESDRSWREKCQANFGGTPVIDVAEMIRSGVSVNGAAALSSLQRLTRDLPEQVVVRDSEALDPEQAGVVWYEISGAGLAGRRDRVWLKIQAVITLTCQRCMGPMHWTVDETAAFVCYEDEAQALASVQDEEDPLAPEPLVVDGPLDVLDLVQDQLILAVPYVPKHETCQPAVKLAEPPDDQALQDGPRQSPFKVLEGLKSKEIKDE